MSSSPVIIRKVVSALPTQLEPSTLYFVRVGTGFDLYLSDVTGGIAHKLNTALASSSDVVNALGFTPYDSTNPVGYITAAALSDYQPLDADLTAIAALTGTTGLLRKTAANAWALDTSAYLTGNQTITLSGDATGSGATGITVSISSATITGKNLAGYVVGANAALASTDTILAALGKIQGQINARLTGNQTITLSGDVTGSGTTAITGTLSNTGVTAGTYPKVTVDAKGRVTAGAALVSADLPTYTGTLTSAQVTTGLGFTPYNATNPSGYITGTGSTTGNAGTATKLQTPRTINGVLFDGTANITVVDGTKLPLAGGTMTGAIAFAAGQTWPTFNQSTTGSAATLTTARTIALSGAATGTATAFNGGANIAIPVTGLDASSLNTGTIPDARLSGTYSGFTHKIDGSNTVYTTPSTGSSSAVARTVYGLAEYRSSEPAQVGAIVFVAPNNTSSVMHQLEVQGLLYARNTVRMTVQGYSYLGAGTAWTDTRKTSSGTVDVQVRWGYTPDGKACLILGDVATSWSYPHFSIVSALLSHSVTDAYCSGWTVGVVTDLSLYTNVTATIGSSAMVGSISGNAATATTAVTAATLQTARTLTVGATGKTFNGSANVAWSLAEIGAPSVTGVGASGTWGINITGHAGSAPGLFEKADHYSVAFTRTANGTASIKAGTIVEVQGKPIAFAAATAIVMPVLTAGTDYCIYACADGTVRADASTSAPTGYTTANSRKIGGFHYAPGGNSAAQAGGDTVVQINPYSFWDLKFKPSCVNPAGMVLVGGSFWADIYPLGVDHHINGTSKYNVTIADASSLPKRPTAFGGDGTALYTSLNWWDASELMQSHGKRLPSLTEFSALAYGTTENISEGTDPVSSILRAVYTSRWGVMLATGNVAVWGAEMGGNAQSSEWIAAAGGRGSTTSLEGAAIYGGAWGYGTASGSRCARWVDPWGSAFNISARGVCSHLACE